MFRLALSVGNSGIVVTIGQDLELENPYKPPEVNLDRADEGWFGFQISHFTGRYLQVCAVLQILTMALTFAFFDRLQVDVTFPLVWWAGLGLLRCNNAARQLVISICFVFVLLASLVFFKAVVFGVEKISISVFQDIPDPSVLQICLVSFAIGAIFFVPMGLLLTSQAKREFAPARKCSITKR